MAERFLSARQARPNPPFPLVNSHPFGSARSRQGREGAKRTLDGEDRAVQSPRSGKGGLKAALRRRSRLRSGALDSEIPRFLFPQK